MLCCAVCCVVRSMRLEQPIKPLICHIPPFEFYKLTRSVTLAPFTLSLSLSLRVTFNDAVQRFNLPWRSERKCPRNSKTRASLCLREQEKRHRDGERPPSSSSSSRLNFEVSQCLHWILQIRSSSPSAQRSVLPSPCSSSSRDV